MKNSFLLPFSCVSLLFSSCSFHSEDTREKSIFLNAKFNLASAAINTTYENDYEPAYFFKIPNSINVIDLFKKEECYIEYRVEIINEQPKTFGSYKIVFADSTHDPLFSEFKYTGIYVPPYGGCLTTNDSLNCLGSQYCRGKYWFVRCEFFIQEISNERLLLEFTINTSYDDLDVFGGV